MTAYTQRKAKSPHSRQLKSRIRQPRYQPSTLHYNTSTTLSVKFALDITSSHKGLRYQHYKIKMVIKFLIRENSF